jgi:hypothetical protein
MFVQHTRVMRTVRSNDRLRRTVKNLNILPQIYLKERQTDCPTIRQITAKCKGKLTINNALLKIYVEYTSL